MNQLILMAEVVQPAQTRYTPDQTPIAEAVVQYPGLRPGDPAGTLDIVGWGNMAQEVQDRCQPGLRLIFEGRLRMSRVERDGFKETVPELSVSKIHDAGNTYLAMGYEPTEDYATAPAPAQVNPDRQVIRQAPAMADAGVGGTVAQPVDEFEGLPF